ncbi:microtubule-associated protein futsch isoform X2 [Cryptotermes secundus]|uniref:microtubule-associated protein futsch isoform X2 n=1 Tax=Cryptotermes secundus TaxID=105785 RepID=UPI000CD7DC88|nr:microtubule-associated protein futsch isoform X2 [Cryptotermes secundus]
MGCVQSYFRKGSYNVHEAHNAGLSPSSTHGSEKAGIPQDPTADVANLVDSPEKEPLDITDLQNDDALNLTEKQNESAPELNGTLKADDGDAGKLTAAATGTAAVIGVATGVAVVNTHNEDSKEILEETEAVTQSGSASISVSPAPADSEADTAEVTEDGEAKSPLSVKSGREVVDVVIKSGAKGEPEDSGSVSTLIPEDTPKSSVESSREPVPEDKLYTAKLDETPEQGSRPSASQIVINEDYVDSKSTSAGVAGTRPTSASLVEGEPVPEQKQGVETSLSPTDKESPSSRPQSTMEQGTESPEGSRPFSATETRRPESSISLSKDEAESAIEATEVAQVDSLPASTGESVDRPASGAQETEETKMTIGSVSEDDNSSRSVAESRKEEEAGQAGSAADNIEFSERIEDSRPDNVVVSIKEGGSRPLSSSELTKQEGSRPTISEVDNGDVSEEPARSRPTSSVESAEEEGNVAAENTEFEKPAEISSLNANELEDSGSRPDILLADTIEHSKENAGSRPVSVTEYTAEDGTRPVNDSQLIKEEGNAVLGEVEMSQDTIGSPLIKADELEAGGRIPENSTVGSLQNSVETADILPVNVAEPTKEVEIRPLSATESNKGNEARPVSSTVDDVNITEGPARSILVTADESTEEEGNRPASTTDKNLEEGRPMGAAIYGKYEESEQNSVAGDEVPEKPVEYRPVCNTTEEKGNRLVEAKNPTKNNESKTLTVSEVVKMEETESSTVESVDVSEDRLGNQPISLAYTTEGEETLPDTAAIPTEETKSRPTSSTVEEAVVVEPGESQTLAKEENIPESAVESTEEVSTSASGVGTTKEDKNISASTAESAKEGGGNRPLSSTDLTEQEGSRPSSAASAVKEEGSRPTSASEPKKDELSSSVSAENSTRDEEIKSAKEECNRSAITLGFTEEESRPDSTVEWNKASGSTRDEGSRPSSVVAEAADLTETLHKIRDSAPDSFTEQGSIPESSATENADNSAELEGTRPVNATESAEEGYRPVSSVTVEKSSSAELGEPEVENESTEVSAEPREEVQTAKYPTVPADTEQETVNTASQPLSSLLLSTGIQEKSEDGTATGEAGNDSRPPTASPSVGAETVAEASEQEGSSSNAVRGTTETESPAYSVNAQTDDIPSLTGTDAAVEPALEDKLTEDEEKPATETDTAEEEAKELNRAATTIQATFRGYQARQTLSKTAENNEVPESVTSHDFLFGPPVQQSVGKGTRNRETGEDQQADSELAELQKPQECDEIHATQEGVSNDASDPDSSASSAATKIQAGVRGFLTRRHVHNMKASNSTTAPSIGNSQKSLGDPLTSQEVEDEGVHTSGSMETEVQKQQQETLNDESQEAPFTTEKVGVKRELSLDSQLDEKVQRPAGSRTAVSLQLDGPVNEDEDRQVWQTLQQEELDEAAIKIQSNYRGYRMRRSLKREDAVQMPTTSTSTFTASSDVIPVSVRHSGEFHDMIVLPPSTEEDLTDASAQNHVATASSTPLQPSDDVTSPAGNQETDMTEASQGGEAKMDGNGEVTAAEAATKIQASYRGFRTRQDIKTANTAASKIQAGFRGYKVRKQLRENTEDKKNGPRNQGSRPQSVNQKEEVEATNQTPAGDVEERSATKIQASVRGYLVRKRRQVERDAAVKIQAGFRGYQARRGLKARQQQQQK